MAGAYEGFTWFYYERYDANLLRWMTPFHVERGHDVLPLSGWASNSDRIARWVG